MASARAAKAREGTAGALKRAAFCDDPPPSPVYHPNQHWVWTCATLSAQVYVRYSTLCNTNSTLCCVCVCVCVCVYVCVCAGGGDTHVRTGCRARSAKSLIRYEVPIGATLSILYQSAGYVQDQSFGTRLGVLALARDAVSSLALGRPGEEKYYQHLEVSTQPG